MTLPDKQNEALARLVGWKRIKTLSDSENDHYIWRRGHDQSVACPNMATPEGADELLEFCQKRGVFITIVPTPDFLAEDYGYHAYAGGREHYPGASAEPTFTRPEAVCKAVLALIEGGYLTEKEPTDGKDT